MSNIRKGPTRRTTLAIIKTFFVMAAVLVLTSWSFTYWQGWAFLATLFLAMIIVTIDVARHDPSLLERRQRAGAAAEKQPAQKVIQAINSVLITGLLVVPGLDHHFGWSDMPWPIVSAGHLLIIAGFAVMLVMLRQNTFGSSIVEVTPDQHVIDTGLYSVVRHPMYSGALLLFLGIPIALGSYWALLLYPLIVGGLVARLLHEERYLAVHLDGYPDYLKTVTWRLIPGLW
jgi:protein-S-isoprenylcysteine O-methyltransferase Ste14